MHSWFPLASLLSSCGANLRRVFVIAAVYAFALNTMMTSAHAVITDHNALCLSLASESPQPSPLPISHECQCSSLCQSTDWTALTPHLFALTPPSFLALRLGLQARPMRRPAPNIAYSIRGPPVLAPSI